MSNSSLYRFSPSLALLLLIACNQEPPSDPRFNDTSLRRPNDSKKLTVVYMDGVAVPAASASAFRTPAHGVTPTPRPGQDAKAEKQAEGQKILWNIPSHWSVNPTSTSIRLAEYRVPGPAGDESEAAEVAVFYLGPSDPGIDDTFRRWAASFEPESHSSMKKWNLEDCLFPTHIMEVSGQYSGDTTMMGEAVRIEPRANWMLIGAIVLAPAGPYFFKFSGPRTTLEPSRDAFLAMVGSFGRKTQSPGVMTSASPVAPKASGTVPMPSSRP